MAILRSPFLGKGRMSIGLWLYTPFQYRSSMSSNFLVFHISGGISSRPVAFLFLIFVSTMSNSAFVNSTSLMISWLLQIFVIVLSVTLETFQADSWNVLTTSVFVLLGWQLLISLSQSFFFYTLSLYHNSSMWLDTWDDWSSAGNPADFTIVGYLTAEPQCKRRNLTCMYYFSFVYILHLMGPTVFNSLYIYIYIISWRTVDEDKPKAPFSIAIIPRCRGGYYSFPKIASINLDLYLIMLSIKPGGIKYHLLSL